MSQREPVKNLLALFSGLLIPLAFAPYSYGLLVLPALALFFYLLESCSARQAFVRGWCFGLGLFGAGLYWVYISIHFYGHVGIFLSVAVTFAMAALLALYPAIFAWLVVRFKPVMPGLRLVLLMPAVWLLMEWTKGWLFTGFPWLTLGYTQIDTALAMYAPIVGVYGLSLLLVMQAGVLTWVLVVGRRAVLMGGLIFALIWLPALLFDEVQWTQALGEPIAVSLVQGNVDQNDKWNPSLRGEFINQYLEMSLGHLDSDIIVWPETAIPAFYHQLESSVIAELDRLGKNSGTSFLVGVPVLDQQRWDYFNAVVALGQGQGTYYKNHLVPFGEYLPLRQWLGTLLHFMDIEMGDFSRGGVSQPLIQAAGLPVSVSICYEAIFETERLSDLPEAALLVNVSNDAWFADSSAPHQHLEMVRMRALEAGRWVLRATNTGITAIIDERGRVVARAPQFEVYVLDGQLQPRSGATPFVIWGNIPVLVLVGLILLGCATSPLFRLFGMKKVR
ncbi:MAG: apolipoprotein N-acyltransferase [Gammaproteobacteria bacterium]|nr:apolipoprotein N-acyltransferase [Gammaproteobacteria bacterium]